MKLADTMKQIRTMRLRPDRLFNAIFSIIFISVDSYYYLSQWQQCSTVSSFDIEMV